MAMTQSPLTQRCDRVMLFFLCMLIYVTPISSSLMEWAFGLAFIAFVIKREAWLYHSMTDLSRSPQDVSVRKIFSAFARSLGPVPSVVNRPIFFFLGVSFASIFVSYHPGLSVKGFIFKVLQGVLTCFMVMETMNSKKRVRIFMFIYFIAIAIVSTNGLFQYITGEGFLRHRPILDGRTTSSFRHANDLGAYLVIALPVLVGFFKSFLNGDSMEDRYKFKGRRPLILTIIALVFVYALVTVGLTYSRGAWLVTALVFFLMVLRHPKILAGVVLMTVIFLSIFTSKMLKERTANIHATKEGIFTSSSRNVFWPSALAIIKEHPFLGVGLNAYTDAAKQFDIEWKGYPHNSYLHMAAEIGIPGMLAFLAIFYRLFRNGLASLKRLKDQFMRPLLYGLMLGLFGFLLHSFLDTFLYSNQLSTLMWVLIGVIAAIQRISFEH